MNSVEVVSEQVRRAAGSVARIVGSGTFDDPENARIIYLAAGGLVLLAVLLGLGTWYWWRTSKVEHPSLGPLEVMGTRGWRKADYNTRARELEAARPANAVHEAEPAPDDDELDLAAIGVDEPAPDAAVDEGADAADGAQEPAEEPVAEAPAAGEPAEPAVETAEPAADADPSPSRGVIVIDTSPSKPAAEQLTLDEAVADEVEEDDGGGEHFDPLLRLNTAD